MGLNRYVNVVYSVKQYSKLRPVVHLKSNYSSRQLVRTEWYVVREAINRKLVFPATYRERHTLTLPLYSTAHVCNVANLRRFMIELLLYFSSDVGWSVLLRFRTPPNVPFLCKRTCQILIKAYFEHFCSTSSNLYLCIRCVAPVLQSKTRNHGKCLKKNLNLFIIFHI